MKNLFIVLMCCLFALPALAVDKKRIVFVAGRESHGNMAHNHWQGCNLLAKALEASGLPIETDICIGGYPDDPESYFKDADAVVVYCDGGGRHVLNANLERFDKYMKKGVGLCCIHYAVETPKGPPGDKFVDWLGGYFEAHWSVNPHWTAEFKSFPKHPIANGVKPFSINDEWYFHMRFRKGMAGVTPILSATAPAETMKRGNGAHSGNPDVRKAVAAGEPQHLAWATERRDGGRGFGFTGGHNHKNWSDDNFRKVVLNALAWIAKVEVPKGGVESKPPEINPTPRTLPPELQDKAVGGAKKKKGASIAPAGMPSPKHAKFASKVITASTPGHAVDIAVDLKGARELYLVAMDGGDGFSCDWSDWVDPVVHGSFGQKKLTDLPWKFASSGYGSVRVNKNCMGKDMVVDGKPVANGIGVHANSIIAYDLPKGSTRFTARGALDAGGTGQGCGSTVQFMVYTQKPAFYIPVAKRSASKEGSHEAAAAVDQLDVHETLDAGLWASEPMLLSPSSIDIDAQGRVWVCEVVNYRRHKTKRPEGDRILVLEDTNQDGKADKSTVFFQGKEVDTAHGVTVLGDLVIIAVGDKVLRFHDRNGDLKADGPGVPMFTGISGTQHDHGIHAFMFGPDGKLYFNFGNAGRQIKDAEGKPIIDKAGNEVKNARTPYQEGMVFRCNMDGSEFETLGWNFRNNWEVTVDSFGTIWQSDNDDDGNRGVRINYVMEFGNYGYKDEKTGRGWKDKRTNIEAETPLRHWHLNDPGVVPNLIQTGAGSPTGILVYEGDLLPKTFQGQVIHCDAGPSITRAYPVTVDGAGYQAEIVNILDGAQKNRWFRPSDVSVMPDGALMVADWYDPGVGGHNMRDLERGRIFRVAPKGNKPAAVRPELGSSAGLSRALMSPNLATRYLAWSALHAKGAAAEAAVQPLLKSDNPRMRARAIWLLGKTPGQGSKWVRKASSDADPDVRTIAIRLARQLADVNELHVVEELKDDASAKVRRECLIALRAHQTSRAASLWADLAVQHDGKDRWYLEALGIASDLNADACLAAWLNKVGKSWNSAAGRDIIWRSRSKDACDLLAQIVKSSPAEDHPRYMRAFDFHSGPEKDKALARILGL